MKARAVLASVALFTRCALAISQSALAQTANDADFTVGDIRVEGLQRVSEGTVYNYLPVNIGDHLNPTRVREAIRALYATGFFRDVQLRRDGEAGLVLELPASGSLFIGEAVQRRLDALGRALGLATRTARRRSPAAALA